MKSFFTTFFAVLAALVLLPLLLLLAVGSIAGSMGPQVPIVENDTVLVINLDENITDSPRMPSFNQGGSLLNMSFVHSLTMLDLIEALEAAAHDENIEALYINFTGSGSIPSTAQMEEIRELLKEFKLTSGKPIVAYNETYTQGSYWLASVADKIYMNPQGGLDWRGLASQSLFYKGAIDKLGVDVQIVRHGTYKSAVEPYMLTEMSPANRRQSEAMVNVMWNSIVDDVAASRSLAPEFLRAYAATLAISSPQKALELGLVDGLKYEDEVEGELALLTDCKKPNKLTLGEYCSTLTPKKVSPNKVAIIYADGQIADGVGSEGVVGGATTAEQVRRAREDESVKAVVLRVNSPGGSALASEVMWRELQLLGEEKPLVVSMSGYAASGGYYISSPAAKILSQRTTLTGSIGVFGVIVSAGGVLKDKIGITVDVAKTSPHADMGTGFRPLSPAEMNYMQRSVEDVYTTFVSRVSAGRNMTPEAVNAIGEGRVWCGADAKEIGLVDEFGGLKEALCVAAECADLDGNWRAVEILEEEDELTAMLNTLFGAKAPRLKGLAGSLEGVARMLEGGTSIQARMPYDITIY